MQALAFFLVLVALILTFVAASPKPGIELSSFNLFRPNVKAVRSKYASLLTDSPSLLNTRSGENDVHVFTIDCNDLITPELYESIQEDPQTFIHHLRNMETVLKESDALMMINQNDLIYVKRKMPFFYTSFVFLTEKEEKTFKKNKNDIKLELHSIGDTNFRKIPNQKSCHISLKVNLQNDLSLKLEVNCFSENIPKKERQILLMHIRDLWKRRVLEALSVTQSRILNKRTHLQVSHLNS